MRIINITFTETPDLKSWSDIQKVLNINAAAKHIQKDYKGPTLGDLHQDVPILKKKSPSSGKALKSS